MIKGRIFVLAVICLSALMIVGVSEAKTDKARMNAPAPDFTIKNIITKKDIHLTDYRGKLTLVNLWATWCPPCREEIPSMNILYQRYNGQLAIIAISMDEAADSDVIDFVKKYNMSFDVAHDDGSLNRIYGTGSIPTTYIVNKDGIIIDKVMGSIRWDSPEAYAYFDKLVSTK